MQVGKISVNDNHVDNDDRMWNFIEFDTSLPKLPWNMSCKKIYCYSYLYCVITINRWYHGRIERDVAEKLLKESGQDSFLVRESVLDPGNYTISVHLHNNTITSVRVDYKVSQQTSVNYVTFKV